VIIIRVSTGTNSRLLIFYSIFKPIIEFEEYVSYVLIHIPHIS